MSSTEVTTGATAPVKPASASVSGSSLLKNFLSGGFGGMCLVLAGQPFDLIKVRMQTMPKPAPGQPPLYTSAMDCVRKTIARDGVRGLYKGMSAPLTGVTPIFAVCFWAYDLAKQLQRQALGLAPDAQLSLNQIGIAGFLSAVPTTALMAPGERIKVILQTQGATATGGTQLKGPIDVIRHLYRTEGVTSLFRGSAATLLRDGFGSYAYFAAYEAIKRYLTPVGSTSLSPTAVLIGGGMAGVANWLVALPIDVVKSRIQMSTAKGARLSMVSVTSQLLKEDGIAGLFKGAGPVLLRAFPANAACFMGMEVSKAFLDKFM